MMLSSVVCTRRAIALVLILVCARSGEGSTRSHSVHTVSACPRGVRMRSRMRTGVQPCAAPFKVLCTLHSVPGEHF